MFKKTFYAFALVAFFATAFATETSSADLEFVASNWLKLADTGDENSEWDQASPIFQSHITRPDWVRTIENMRHQLGRTISREVSGVEKRRPCPECRMDLTPLFDSNRLLKNYLRQQNT